MLHFNTKIKNLEIINNEFKKIFKDINKKYSMGDIYSVITTKIKIINELENKIQ